MAKLVQTTEDYVWLPCNLSCAGFVYRRGEGIGRVTSPILSRLRRGAAGLPNLRGFLLIATLAALVPASLNGQTSDGSAGTIAGHVRGPGGVSVPGATVLVTDPQTGQRKETWTDEAGNYVISGLNPGTYKLEVSLVGFRPDAREPVPVTAGRTLKVNIALVIALPESATAATPANRDAGPKSPENLQAGAAQMPARTPNLGLEETTPAGANGGTEGNLRFSEGAAASAPAQGDFSGPEGNPATSAANSFLLSGSNGISASTPGDDMRRMRGRFQQFRDQAGGQALRALAAGAGEWAEEWRAVPASR